MSLSPTDLLWKFPLGAPPSWQVYSLHQKYLFRGCQAHQLLPWEGGGLGGIWLFPLLLPLQKWCFWGDNDFSHMPVPLVSLWHCSFLCVRSRNNAAAWPWDSQPHHKHAKGERVTWTGLSRTSSPLGTLLLQGLKGLRHPCCLPSTNTGLIIWDLSRQKVNKNIPAWDCLTHTFGLVAVLYGVYKWFIASPCSIMGGWGEDGWISGSIETSGLPNASDSSWFTYGRAPSYSSDCHFIIHH